MSQSMAAGQLLQLCSMCFSIQLKEQPHPGKYIPRQREKSMSPPNYALQALPRHVHSHPSASGEGTNPPHWRTGQAMQAKDI